MAEEFPSNSRKQKAEDAPKNIEKVVDGDVVRRKKPLSKRFAETFVGGDAKSAAGYVMFDVLIPAAKDMVVDAVVQGAEKIFYGEARSTGRRGYGRSSGTGYVSYNRFSSPSRREDSRREDPRPNLSRRARTMHDFDEIILDSRHEAQEVIDRLFDLVSRYDEVTVRDFYDLVGISATPVDEKWGWNDIRGAGVTRVRGGYLLDLPRPMPLD